MHKDIDGAYFSSAAVKSLPAIWIQLYTLYYAAPYLSADCVESWVTKDTQQKSKTKIVADRQDDRYSTLWSIFWKCEHVNVCLSLFVSGLETSSLAMYRLLCNNFKQKAADTAPICKIPKFFPSTKQVYCFPALNDGTAFPPFFSLYLQHQWEMFQVCSFHLTQLYQKTDSTRQSYNSTLISLLHSSRARSYTYQTNSLAMQQIY